MLTLYTQLRRLRRHSGGGRGGYGHLMIQHVIELVLEFCSTDQQFSLCIYKQEVVAGYIPEIYSYNNHYKFRRVDNENNNYKKTVVVQA